MLFEKFTSRRSYFSELERLEKKAFFETKKVANEKFELSEDSLTVAGAKQRLEGVTKGASHDFDEWVRQKRVPGLINRQLSLQESELRKTLAAPCFVRSFPYQYPDVEEIEPYFSEDAGFRVRRCLGSLDYRECDNFFGRDEKISNKLATNAGLSHQIPDARWRCLSNLFFVVCSVVAVVVVGVMCLAAGSGGSSGGSYAGSSRGSYVGSSGGSYVGPRGGVYHYSASGGKVYSRR